LSPIFVLDPKTIEALRSKAPEVFANIHAKLFGGAV
jgi:hypothetical protein